MQRVNPGPRSCYRPHRRATVLVMVVALLGMLFVAGVAFLSTVSFESTVSKTIEQTEERDQAVDAVEEVIFGQLVRSWLGDDGIPYNYDVSEFLPFDESQFRPPDERFDPQRERVVDVYGMAPGYHPLVASVEPFATKDQTRGRVDVFAGTSNLQLARRGAPAYRPDLSRADEDMRPLSEWTGGAGGPLPPLPLVEFPDDSGWWRSPACVPNKDKRLSPYPGKVGFAYRPDTNLGDAVSDADGDGVVDALSAPLDVNQLGWETARLLSNQLRHPDVTDGDLASTGLGLTSTLLGLRVISNGAMVNVSQVNGSHERLVSNLLGETYGEELCLGTDYQPETEERVLRHRFFLPPRDPVPSRLVEEQLPNELLGRLVVGNQIRWWPMGVPVDPHEDLDLWNNWMDPQSDTYDWRHLLTTISYDDLLLRGRRDYDPKGLAAVTAAPLAPLRALAFYPLQDWSTAHLSDTEGSVPDVDDSDDWPTYQYAFRGAVDAGFGAWDYRQPLPWNVDPTMGRRQLSLLSLDGRQVLFKDADNKDVLAWRSSRFFPCFQGHPEESWINKPTLREIRTVQGAFALMLRNVNTRTGTGQDMQDWRDDQAAALTANSVRFR